MGRNAALLWLKLKRELPRRLLVHPSSSDTLRAPMKCRRCCRAERASAAGASRCCSAPLVFCFSLCKTLRVPMYYILSTTMLVFK